MTPDEDFATAHDAYMAERYAEPPRKGHTMTDPGERVTVEYADGTTASFAYPQPWAAFGTGEFAEQLAPGDPSMQSRLLGIMGDLSALDLSEDLP